MKKQQLIWIIVAMVVAILIALGIFLMAESPLRVMKGAIKDIEAHRAEKVLDHVDENLTPAKQQEIEKVIKQLTDANSVSGKISTDESWRLQDDVVSPTKKYFASNYRATVSMTVDGQTIDVTFRLRRQGATNEFKIFSFLFKPWVITNVKIEK